MASRTRAMRAFADSYFDEWTDPNLTEPKLQDELNHRLAAPDTSRRQRPRAARRELKSAPDNDPAGGHGMTQIRYFKYIPYRGMSEPERRKYLSLGPARLTSSRTEPTPRPQRGSTVAAKPQEDDEAAFWQSASKSKSLKVYDYHLAELSLAYRSPPSLLNLPRRLATSSGSRPEPRHPHQQQATAPVENKRKSLFYQIHTSRTARASTQSDTQRQLTMAEKTTQVSRGCTPFIESALSDNFPTEPGDVVSKSESNRLLNVVSVDECHIRHRRRRRRLRRVERAAATAEGDDQDVGEEEEEAEEEEEDWDEEEEEDVERVGRVEEPADDQEFIKVPTEQPEPSALEQRHGSDADAVVPSVISTRPTTERSKKSKRRSEKEMRRLAAAKFLRRNEILREKMAIYLDWKLNQERMGLAEIREGDPASRFERFTVELVRQEALVANQYRGMGQGDAAGAVADNLTDEYYSSPTLMLDTQRGVGGGEEGESRLRPELSLSEMFEALRA